MFDAVRPALSMLLCFTVLLGGVYPLAVTGAAQLLFPGPANGSLVERDGVVIGSSLVGQPFDDPGWFWGRPSATGPFPYNAAASTGSNLGPLNPVLHDAVAGRVAALSAPSVPVDLLTTSGSGLDPHLTPASALFQVERVAAARGLPEAQVRDLVLAHVEGRTLGVLGEPRVNVLALNLALLEIR